MSVMEGEFSFSVSASGSDVCECHGNTLLSSIFIKHIYQAYLSSIFIKQYLSSIFIKHIYQAYLSSIFIKHIYQAYL